jgi:hypothetical protein
VLIPNDEIQMPDGSENVTYLPLVTRILSSAILLESPRSLASFAEDQLARRDSRDDYSKIDAFRPAKREGRTALTRLEFSQFLNALQAANYLPR